MDCELPKLDVAGSIPVSRSISITFHAGSTIVQPSTSLQLGCNKGALSGGVHFCPSLKSLCREVPNANLTR